MLLIPKRLFEQMFFKCSFKWGFLHKASHYLVHYMYYDQGPIRSMLSTECSQNQTRGNYPDGDYSQQIRSKFHTNPFITFLVILITDRHKHRLTQNLLQPRWWR